MKVKELIEELQKFDQEEDVVLSSDAEGNHFHLAEEVGNGYFGFDHTKRKVIIWPSHEEEEYT